MKTETKRAVNAYTFSRIWNSAFLMPLLALLTALVLGALVIWVSSGSFLTVIDAYSGLVRGALFKERGLSESLVATIPYVLLSLAVAVGFKAGLFNIGVEGQFYIGAICAAWAGQVTDQLPAVIHLPFTLLSGALGGAIWAAVPGYLKARTGAHEVITTIMLNYVSFRFVEYAVSGPLRDLQSSAVQTPHVSASAELWSVAAIPERLQDPLNALAVAMCCGLVAFLVARVIRRRRERLALARPVTYTIGRGKPARAPSFFTRHSSLVAAVVTTALVFVALPVLVRLWWPFTDPYDRLHIGLLLALVAAVAIWWLLWKTTIGFELRTVGANPNAARYAGMNITRNVVLAMAISGALAGVAGTVEVLGVSICRCLPMFFSSGYGFDSIAIALLANNNPFGILGVSFLFGAMRNGADLMELNSGVSKYVISLIQALILLFTSAPVIMRWVFRVRVDRKAQEGPLTRGWGGSA
ncbi:MAG: ABC transporter permease [Chloroflexi bacterium]|nr:ABC transporter permease [Chloroflexota bacterium]